MTVNAACICDNASECVRVYLQWYQWRFKKISPEGHAAVPAVGRALSAGKLQQIKLLLLCLMCHHRLFDGCRPARNCSSYDLCVFFKQNRLRDTIFQTSAVLILKNATIKLFTLSNIRLACYISFYMAHLSFYVKKKTFSACSKRGLARYTFLISM